MDTKTQKHVLITGAYGGMGKAAVKAFLDAGFHVFALDKFVEDPQQNVTPVKVDITNLTALYAAFNEINKQVDKLFAVVHFAGIYTLGSLIEMGEDEFVKSFNVNLFGAFRVNKVFAPMLKNGGKILIVTSELAPLAPLPFTGIYALTKSALDNYAYSLRMEVVCCTLCSVL